MLRAFVILALLLSPISSSLADDYLLTFQTTDCNGDTGFASIEIGKVYKVQAMQCDPPHQAEIRKQVLTGSRTDITEYDVFTVTQEEAERIRMEIKEYMRIRRELLEKSDGVIITH